MRDQQEWKVPATFPAPKGLDCLVLVAKLLGGSECRITSDANVECEAYPSRCATTFCLRQGWFEIPSSSSGLQLCSTEKINDSTPSISTTMRVGIIGHCQCLRYLGLPTPGKLLRVESCEKSQGEVAGI